MIFEMINCGGCKTCELACGFHHSGAFDPRISSIKVIDRLENLPGFKIEIRDSEDNNSLNCDGCFNRPTPLCVEYCHEKDDLLMMIKEVLAEKENQISIKNNNH